MNAFARGVRDVENIEDIVMIADIHERPVGHLFRAIHFEGINDAVQKIKKKAQKIHGVHHMPALFVGGEEQTVLFGLLFAFFLQFFLLLLLFFDLFR